MEILGYIASVLIGISLGLVGSGGSILTVPVLVYLMHLTPLEATASSLFIVGATSLVGGMRAYSRRQVDFEAITAFGIPSIFSIFITRHYILPDLPHQIGTLGTVKVTSDMLLMIVFAVLMLAASLSMIRSRIDELQPVAGRTKTYRPLPLALLGLFIGFITGLLGAGGGFLIIPSLVLLLRLPMRRAVGTSLLIIAINSLMGFVFSLKQFSYHWNILLIVTALSIGGLFAGSKIAEKIPGRSLRKGFGWFILVMGLYIIIRELVLS